MTVLGNGRSRRFRAIQHVAVRSRRTRHLRAIASSTAASSVANAEAHPVVDPSTTPRSPLPPETVSIHNVVAATKHATIGVPAPLTSHQAKQLESHSSGAEELEVVGVVYITYAAVLAWPLTVQDDIALLVDVTIVVLGLHFAFFLLGVWCWGLSGEWWWFNVEKYGMKHLLITLQR